MDYVVAGFGVGAILALIGFALWELFGNVEEPGMSWLSRAAIGLMLGSLVIWAVTGVSLISHIDDSTGSHLVLLTTLVTLVAIAAGTFWYWRIDREYAAAHPRPAKASVQREVVAAAAAPAVTGDLELTEWDSWPERETTRDAVPAEVIAEASATASFEPEVAVKPVIDPALAEADAAPAAGPSDTDSKLVEPPSVVGAAVVPESGEVVWSNIRPFPIPAAPALDTVSDEVVLADDVDIVAEEVIPPPVDDPAPVAIEVETVEAVADVNDLELDTSVQPVSEAADDDADAVPETFESSLLADIDGSLAADDGGFRSPLLTDLGGDQLEGVGLAKWRPDARLTADREEADKEKSR